MIKIENVVLASPEQMMFIIQGMRNPMNSWGNSDSDIARVISDDGKFVTSSSINSIELGSNDHSLMQRLSNAGTDHRKFMRMMPVYARITAPLYFWKEYDTYKVSTVANSCSTMHKIQEKTFTLKDFSTEHLMTSRVFTRYAPTRYRFSSMDLLNLEIEVLNQHREKYLETGEKIYWWQMIQLLPSSYNQTRNVMMNYEVLANMYKSRKGHKLHEWREFCKWIEELPYSELITGKEVND